MICDLCNKEIEGGYKYDFKKIFFVPDDEVCDDCWIIVEEYQERLKGEFQIELKQKTKVFIEKLKKEKNENTSD